MGSRRKFLMGIASGLVVVGGAGYYFTKPKPVDVGFTLKDESLQQAIALMQANPVIDAHAHPGRTFVRDGENLNWKLWLYSKMGTFEASTVADMHEGGVSASVFNGVADFQLLALTDTGLNATREFLDGEDWQAYQTQIANLKALENDGLVRIARTAADIRTNHTSGKISAILGMEGADFLNGDMDRLQTVYDDGVRMLTLAHYHDNTLGDIMTSSGTRGLTAFGADVVAEMNQTGMMIDIAHASDKMAHAVVAASSKPVLVTHTHINGGAITHPRFISKDLALAVAEGGGVIGAWPAGIGITTLSEFIDRTEELLNIVGEDHVVLGSDMDANYKPVLETYRKMPLVVGALLERGHSPETVTKFIGGNFLRVMKTVEAG